MMGQFFNKVLTNLYLYSREEKKSPIVLPSALNPVSLDVDRAGKPAEEWMLSSEPAIGSVYEVLELQPAGGVWVLCLFRTCISIPSSTLDKTKRVHSQQVFF